MDNVYQILDLLQHVLPVNTMIRIKVHVYNVQMDVQSAQVLQTVLHAILNLNIIQYSTKQPILHTALTYTALLVHIWIGQQRPVNGV